jgi:hypothetical protein
MVDEVSACLAATLAISENGKVRFGSCGSVALSQHHYAVGRVLASRKSVDPKAFMGTIAKIWGFRNRLSINEHASGRFIFKFSRLLERDQTIKGVPWFFGKAMVVLALYDGLGDPTKMELSAFPVWVHIIGLPSALVTSEVALLVGETLGSVLQVDKVGIRRGDFVRVRIRHVLTNLVKQAFPPYGV